MTISSRRRSRSALLAMTFLLVGCSAFKILYTFADGFVDRKARQFLLLSTTEEDFLSLKITAMFDWHRTQMLPIYADFFEAQAGLAEAGDITPEATDQAVMEVRHLMEVTMEGAAPFIAQVLIRHTSKKHLDYMQARLGEDQAEKLADLEQPYETRLEDRIDRTQRNFERFTGPLTEAQREIIKVHVEASMGDAAKWLDNRAKRQAATIAFLATGPDEVQIADFAKQIVLRAHEITDPDYQAQSERRWAAFADLQYKVMVSLDAVQRESLVNTLRSYAADMRNLAEG